MIVALCLGVLSCKIRTTVSASEVVALRIERDKVWEALSTGLSFRVSSLPSVIPVLFAVHEEKHLFAGLCHVKS